MRVSMRVGIFFLPLFTLAACSEPGPTRSRGGSDAGEAATGSSGAECYPNGTCNGALDCIDGRCQGADTDTGAGCNPFTGEGCEDTGSADTGCNQFTGEGCEDTGTADTGSTDTGSTDTGSTDTGRTDSGADTSDTGVTDTGAEDTTVGPTTDLCLNAADRAVLAGDGTAAVTEAAQGCGLGCLGDADPGACAGACLAIETGLSNGCAGCYAGVVVCSITNCLAPCAADPASVDCTRCQQENCDAEFALCAGLAPIIDAVCGNGVVEAGEGCDDGNTESEDCAYGAASCSICDSSCQVASGVPHFCGDGFVDVSEVCDDGNAVGGDGCSSVCACDPSDHLAGGSCERSTLAYITGGDVLSVVNTATSRVVGTILGLNEACGVALNPAGNRAYVTTHRLGSVLSVLDLTTNRLIANIPGSMSDELAINAEGTTAYVTNMDYDTVSVVDLAAGVVTDSIPVGGMPRGIALSPGGGRAYVTNADDASVSVINTATNTVIAVVNVGFGSGPARVALNSSGSRAYVANNGLHTVSVIDTSRNVVVATVDPAFGLLTGPFGIVVHPSRSLAFIANMWGGGVTIMDTGANVIRTRIALPIYSDPDMSLMYVVGLDPTGSSLFAAGFSVDGDAWLSTIDINTNLVTSNVNLSDIPCGMVVR